MNYQPLTLKTTKSSTGATAKVGVVTHQGDQPEPRAYQVKVLTRRNSAGKVVGYRIGVKVDDVWRLAGYLYKQGVGRYGVKSLDADSREVIPGYQPFGYTASGTLSDLCERVVHGFLTNVEYAARQAATATD